jgi:hypothetical protein
VAISSSQADSAPAPTSVSARPGLTVVVIDGRDLAYATVCADPDQAIAHIAANQPGRPREAAPRG